MRRVIVHIDSLVLKGFRHEDRYDVAEGLQQELTDLLATPDLARRLVQLGHLPRVRAGQVSVKADAGPLKIGVATAKRIGRGLGK